MSWLRHFVGEIVPRIEHRAQDAFDLELRIHRRLDLLDGADQRRQPFERVVLALHRDQHALRRDQRVQREHVQRRRAVDEDDFVLVVDGLERVAQRAARGPPW